uniref:Ig-like domain-containing protein n=1 Tax=Mastacembelus armatus TaxID=205130 RepID=A0A3Q3LV60_9TELE
QDRLRSNLHDASCDRWTLLRSTIVLHYTLACVLLTPCCAGQNQVTGPSQTILVTAGDDVVLPCYLGPTVDASGKTVEWTKQDLEPRFVLVWRDGAELQNQKNPDYKGRTSLLIDKLTYGDVSLKVSRVRISDRGKYRCFTPSLGKESTVELVVGAVSFITINLKKNNTVSGAVELDCESKGWYPEPEVLWLDSEGNLLSAGPTETLRAPDDLYTVSSRLTVEKRHGNSFTCRVQQTRINQTRLTHIQLSGTKKRLFTFTLGFKVKVLRCCFL